MKLPLHRFKRIVKDSVLVALDLLIFNDKGEVLVGLRRNSPAKGRLFMPGGRIYKGENLRSALRRISKSETGVDLSKENGTLYGVYDHLYRDNAFGEPGVSTHYVVIACLFNLRSFATGPHDNQHEALRMMSIQELLAHPKVHSHTRNYFVPNPPNVFLQVDDSQVYDRSATRSCSVGRNSSADKSSTASVHTTRASSTRRTTFSKRAAEPLSGDFQGRDRNITEDGKLPSRPFGLYQVIR
jgi:colanic acid biosynthesis protein WcaH